MARQAPAFIWFPPGYTWMMANPRRLPRESPSARSGAAQDAALTEALTAVFLALGRGPAGSPWVPSHPGHGALLRFAEAQELARKCGVTLTISVDNKPPRK